MLIQDREQFVYAKSVLLDADVIAVDTETHWTDKWDERFLMGFSTFCEVKGRDMEIAFYFPFDHEHDNTLFGSENLPVEWLREFEAIFQRDDVTLLFHNAKFDLQVFKRSGVDITAPFYDTMLMSYMVDENSTHALKKLGVLHISSDADDEQQDVKKLTKLCGGWDNIPPDAMEPYACKDVELTYRLWEFFTPQLQAQELDGLWPDEADFCRCLQLMEERGIRLDIPAAKQQAYLAEARMQAIQEKLGFDPAKPRQLAHKLYSQPPEGLGLLPVALGKNLLASPIVLSNGKVIRHIPAMGEDMLQTYNDPIIADVLDYREAQKALSTWFSGFLDKVCADGRLHPNFKQHGTKTTRLSCAEPNLQQLPRDIERGVKTLMLPTEGYELWEFDYSQVEFRLAACYAKEPVLIEGYLAGNDFHSITAELLGISRQHAKTVNFAILYGAGPRKLAEQLNCSESEGRQVLAQFRDAYPRLAQVAQDAEKAAQRGWIRYWTGRRRHFEFPSEYHKAFNSVVQGGAAEIMKRTMLKFYREYPEIRMVCQVHDALWFETQSEEELDIIQKVMEWPGTEFPTPFPVDRKRLN